MKRIFFPIILFFLLVTEGTALYLLPASLTSMEIMIVPHWVFVFLVFVSLFYDTNDTYYAIVYGVIFGLLIDIVYTGVLGIYMFVYPVSLYCVHLFKRFFQTNLLMTIFLSSIGIVITELLLFVIFSFIGIVNIYGAHFIVQRLLPTILANILFLIPLYFLLKEVLIKWSKEQLVK